MTRRIEDPDNPEWTPEMFARAQRGIDHVPGPMREAIQQARRGRGPQKAPKKELVSLRLSQYVLTAYKSTGPGWQRRIDEDLQRSAPKVIETAKGKQAAHYVVFRKPQDRQPGSAVHPDVYRGATEGRTKVATHKTASKKR